MVVCDAVYLYLTAGIWKLTKLVLWCLLFDQHHHGLCCEVSCVMCQCGSGGCLLTLQRDQLFS